MAKLYLKFDAAVLKEIKLSQGVVTIGRLPDNLVQVDNLAVSGHHAKIYWDQNHYVLEDNNSLNGTFVNNQRTSKAILKDEDVVLIGKHTLVFKDEAGAETREGTIASAPLPTVPKLDATAILETKKAKEMLAASPQTTAAVATAGPGSAAVSSQDRIGVLTVIAGKTDEPHYILTGKMSVIGKSDMASIKLKGWFAPKMAALINRRENKYLIAASEKQIRVLVNGETISGQRELADGDLVEIAGVKMTFGFRD